MGVWASPSSLAPPLSPLSAPSALWAEYSPKRAIYTRKESIVRWISTLTGRVRNLLCLLSPLPWQVESNLSERALRASGEGPPLRDKQLQ